VAPPPSVAAGPAGGTVGHIEGHLTLVAGHPPDGGSGGP